jgi:hypothetical protein
MNQINQKSGVWKTTFRDFALWWNKRNRLSCSYEFKNNIIYSSSLIDQEFYFEIEMANGFNKIVSGSELNNGVLLDEAKSLHLDRNFNHQSLLIIESAIRYPALKHIKQRLKHYLDWEVKTPIGQLHPNGFRAIIKYLLRLIYDNIPKSWIGKLS